MHSERAVSLSEDLLQYAEKIPSIEEYNEKNNIYFADFL